MASVADLIETHTTDTPTLAYLLHARVMASPRLRSSTDPGYMVYRGALAPHLRALVPHVADADLPQVKANVYSYLRASDNAVCVSVKDPTSWKLRRVWNPDAPVYRHHVALTKREARLTPEEAGETRAPAPVTITHVSATTQEIPMTDAPTLDRTASLAAHRAKLTAERNSAMDKIVSFLDEEPEAQPLVIREVAAIIAAHESTARQYLAELLTDGRVFSRVETTEERIIRLGGTARATPASLYSTISPVPERTKRTVVEGVTASLATSTQAAPGENTRKILREMNTRWRPVSVLHTRLRMTENAAHAALQRAHRDGLVDRKKMVYKDGADRPVWHYRALSETTPLESLLAPTPATPEELTLIESSVPGPTRSAAIEAPSTTIDVAKAIADMIGEATADLRSANDHLAARVAELEAELETAQAKVRAARIAFDAIQ